MTDDERRFYDEEKTKLTQLLNRFGWTEEHLLEKQEPLFQCPFDRHHRFPRDSKHVQNCQLKQAGFSKDYFQKESIEIEQEKQLLKQSGILLTPSMISHILQRPVPIADNMPLSIEQTTILFTPEERSLLAQTVHDEALRLGIVPSALTSILENPTTESKSSNVPEQLDKFAEVRDQKRRRTKYITRTVKKSFYDIAREMINTQMELIPKQDSALIPHEKHGKKHKHRSGRSDSRKHHHHRHSKKRRRS